MVSKQDILEYLLLIILCGLMLSCLAYGAARLIMRFSVPNVGTFQTIGIGAYCSNDASDPVTNFSWPTMFPNSNASVTLWMFNNGTVPVQLSYANDSWNPPECAFYMNTTWTGDNQTLAAGQWLQTDYTLTVSADCQNITSFSFKTTFTGTQFGP